MFIEALKKFNIIFAIIMLFSSYSEHQKFVDYANEAGNSKYDDLIEFFSDVVTDGYYVERWEYPMYISVTGDYTQEDYDFITSIVEKIDSMGVMPEISIDEEQSNCSILFGSLDELESYYSKMYESDYYDHGYYAPYEKGDWWCVDLRMSLHRIYEASIGIASDVTTQEERNYMILLCIANAIGLQYGSDKYPESICYSEWTNAQSFSDLDYLLITMLYSKELHAGLYEADAEDILRPWVIRHLTIQ